MADVANARYNSAASAFAYEGWSDEMQPFLMKSLVAKPIANTNLASKLDQGQTVHMPYMGTDSSVTVTDYTAGSAIAISAATAADETLTADKRKVAAAYLDDVNSLQSNYSQRQELQKRMVYELKDQTDQDFFTTTSALTGSTATRLDAGYMTASSHDTSGITAGTATNSSTAGIIDIFSKAKTFMRNNNVPESGDWFATVSNEGAELIEKVAIDKGFNVADTSLRNGYVGDFMGFQVYRSTNLHADSSTAGGFNGTDYWLFGKKGGIDLAIQKAPGIEVKEVSDKLGANILAHTVYGTKLFTKKKDLSLVAPVGKTV